MSKAKFYFNTKSLTFEKVQLRFWDRVKKIFTYLLTGLVFASATLLVAYNLFDSPKEKRLKREIEQLTYQYEDLSNRLNQLSFVLSDMQQRDDNIYRMIFESEPVPIEVRNAGFGGVDIYKKLEGFDNSALMIEVTKKLDRFAKQAYIQSRSFDQVVNLARNKQKLLSAIPAIQPISKLRLRHMSGFGYRMHPIYKTSNFHPGIDFSAPTGTPIYATGDGVIERADNLAQGYGNHVVVSHGFGYQTLYGHMSRIKVRAGQKIRRGEVIGFVGSTGLSTAPHVHYEIIKSGQKINPVNYFYADLSPSEYQEMVRKAEEANQSFD